MRVPQNIPLSKQLHFRRLIAVNIDRIQCSDDLVPVYVKINAITQVGLTGGAIYVNKSYKNYEPPISYIVPRGYKAQTTVLSIPQDATSDDYTFDSVGLGFVCVLEINSSAQISLIEIVKE